MLSLICTRLAVPCLLGAASLLGYGMASQSFPPPGSNKATEVKELAELAEVEELAEIEEEPEIADVPAIDDDEIIDEIGEYDMHDEDLAIDEEMDDEEMEFDDAAEDEADDEADDEAEDESDDESDDMDDPAADEAEEAQQEELSAMTEQAREKLAMANQRMAREAQAAERTLAIMVAKHRKANGEQKDQLRAEIEKLVNQQFQQRLSAHKARVDKLLQEVERIQAQLARREELGPQIVERRIQELLGEKDELSWEDEVTLPIEPSASGRGSHRLHQSARPERASSLRDFFQHDEVAIAQDRFESDRARYSGEQYEIARDAMEQATRQAMAAEEIAKAEEMKARAKMEAHMQEYKEAQDQFQRAKASERKAKEAELKAREAKSAKGR